MTEQRRRRGAQPGNTNAVKHGFYSDRFKSGEIDDLAALAQVQNGLTAEIDLLRVLIRRVFEHAADQAAEGGEGEQSPLQIWSDALGALGTASTRLAGLLRMQQVLSSGSSNEILDALSTALREVTNDIGCK